MSEETTATDQAQASAEESAAFSAGFEGAEDTAAAQAGAASGGTDEAGTKDDSPGAAPGATASATPAPAPEYAQITRADWDRMQTQQADLLAELGRVRDHTNGQIGGLQRVLTQAQAEAVVTAEDFGGLREIGLDEIADALAKDLGGVLKKAPRVVHAEGGAGGAAVDPEAVTRQVIFDIGVRSLKRAHPDFAEIRDSAEFQAFLAAKPQAEQDEFISSLDPEVVVPVFTEFKAARKKAADSAANATASMRRNRFAAAETPRGSPAQPQRGQTELEAFREGFATG